jgi:hypothetical protein
LDILKTRGFAYVYLFFDLKICGQRTGLILPRFLLEHNAQLSQHIVENPLAQFPLSPAFLAPARKFCPLFLYLFLVYDDVIFVSDVIFGSDVIFISDAILVSDVIIASDVIFVSDAILVSDVILGLFGRLCGPSVAAGVGPPLAAAGAVSNACKNAGRVLRREVESVHQSRGPLNNRTSRVGLFLKHKRMLLKLKQTLISESRRDQK